MRIFGSIVVAVSIAGAVLAAPATAPVAGAPATTGSAEALFAGLVGRTCQGALVQTKVKLGDTAATGPTETIPIGMTWFRGSDGGAWVDFKYGTRAPVPRQVRVTDDGFVFYGAFGQPFVLRGTVEELAGPTYPEEAVGTVQVRCAADPEAAAAVHVLPANPVRQVDFISRLNGQSYRLMLRVPAEPAPAGGYPVLYVLDGNYYFGTVSDVAKRLIAQRIARPFVVVGVGYPTEDRGEQSGRRDSDLSLPVPVLVERYGGADMFLRVIEEEVKPLVTAQVPVAAGEQALYGHSFGGLAALRTLFRHPGAFSTYILSSPSIWWADKAVLADEAGFSQRVQNGAVHARVLITSAGDEQRGDVLGGDKEAAVHRMVDNASELTARLATLNPRALPVSRVVFEGEVHQSVPQASVSRAVRFAFPP